METNVRDIRYKKNKKIKKRGLADDLLIRNYWVNATIWETLEIGRR